MALKNFSNFIYLSKNTKGVNGKPVYISPDLIPDLLHQLSSLGAGQLRNIRTKMENDLRAIAIGTKAGKAVNKPSHYYMDFTYKNLTSLRFYYQVFQNKIPEINRGSGLYIYSLKSSLLNEDQKEGLYKVEHNQFSYEWEATENQSNTLDLKDFMIGAYKVDGTYGLRSTTEKINRTRPENDKMPFNLYYSPGYLVENGLEWTTPMQRISKTAGADEIAGILINSENQWTAGNLNAYNTQVFSESSKIVEQALKIVKRKGVKLTKHNFIFHSPLTSFQKLKQITTDCGAKFDEKSYSLGLKSKAHLLSQKNGSLSNKGVSIPNLDKNSQKSLTQKIANFPARTQNTTLFDYLELIK